MLEDPPGRWAVALTRSAQERRAVENLRRQAYEAFFPLISRPSKTDVRHLVDVPLFPCYVFVRIRADQPWGSINSTYGVVRLLTNRHRVDPQPLYVPDSKVNEVSTLSKRAVDPLPPGTVVRVRARGNPFFDTIGAVEAMDRTTRVSVLMCVFNRDVAVRFDPLELEVISESPHARSA